MLQGPAFVRRRRFASSVSLAQSSPFDHTAGIAPVNVLLAEGWSNVALWALSQRGLAMENDAPFAKLKARERKALLKSGERLTFSPGDLILRQGQTQGAIYVVDKGHVRVERRLRVRAKYVIGDGSLRVDRDPEGEDESYTNVEIARLDKNAVFGEMSFLDPAPISANVIAHDHVVVVRIDGADVKKFIKGDPTFAGRFYHSLATILVRRLRVATKRAASRYIP